MYLIMPVKNNLA